MNSCVFVLPNERAAAYKAVTFIIVMMNVLAFSFVCLNTNSNQIICLAIVGIISLVITVLHYLFMMKNKSRTINIHFALIFCAMVWLVVGMNVMAFGLLLFAVLGIYANKTLKVEFWSDGIVYPAFLTKQLKWNEVEQVVLKDNILSIDLKNNKLIQFNIQSESNQSIDEVEFNEFCKTCASAK